MRYSLQKFIRLTCATVALFTTIAVANPARYDDELTSTLANCSAIEPGESQSGLYMNPAGLQSYYVRSKCLQDAAVKFRAPDPCNQVRQRRALFASSWGVSQSQCAALVSAAQAEDLRVIQTQRAAYATQPVTLQSFTIVRNGNGRDFNIIPVFRGPGEARYTLVFELLVGAQTPITLHRSSRYLQQGQRLNLYLRQADVRQMYPAFSMESTYTVRARMIYGIAPGTAAARWSGHFIDQNFPETARTQLMDKVVSFGATTFTPEPIESGNEQSR